MRIAVDAMGGDRAPRETVEGALLAARDLGIGLLLVGDRAPVESELKRHKLDGVDVELRHASETVAMDESPIAALRKPDTSLRVGLLAVREGEAAGFVFGGNTGAGVLLASQLLGCVAGIERPAIAALVPSKTGHTILLDAGANVDCRPVHLAQLAMMGDAYARAVRHVAAPRIGLLSNGLEETKGNTLVRAAAPLLRQLPINFVGYVEGREVSSGSVDVVVCDGFVGNVLLKGFEGLGGLVSERIRAAFAAGLRGRLAAMLIGGRMRAVRDELDASETGGALLLGLSGVAVKAHGASDARAFRNAVALAADLARGEITTQIGHAIAGTIALIEPKVEETSPGLWRSLRRRLRRGPSASGEPRPTSDPPAWNVADPSRGEEGTSRGGGTPLDGPKAESDRAGTASTADSSLRPGAGEPSEKAG